MCLADDGVDRNHDDVTVTSPADTSTESVVAVAVDHVQPSNHVVVSRWLLVNRCPHVCYWLETNVANQMRDDDVTRRIDDVMSLCGGSRLQQQQQQRSPLTILFGSAVTSTATTSARSRPADAVAAPPWRPFSVHEDQPSSTAPSLSTTASSNCAIGDVRGSAAVDEVDQAVPSYHTVLRSALGRQYTATDCLSGIPFVPVLPDGLYSHVVIDQLHRQLSPSPVRQQVVDGGFVYPTAVAGYGISTARQQCSQCGVVFATLSDLIRHQQSSCSCLSKSSSSSSPPPPQSGSTGSPPTRSPSPLLACPHCDKTYASSGALKMHVRTHTLPCRCSVCGKSFSRPWLLQGHLRTHTGERPFSCAVCGRAFADRSNLRAHGQTHSAAKRYQCTTCRRSFSRLSLLVRHERHSASGCCRGRHGNDDAARVNRNISSPSLSVMGSIHVDVH